MKFNSKKAITLLAVAGLAFASTAVHAATTAYTTGDLILGFRQTGATSSLLVNIGQAGGYRDGTTTGNLSLGNLGADLTSLFGSGWSSDATVFWGVVGSCSSRILRLEPGFRPQWGRNWISPFLRFIPSPLGTKLINQ